MSSLFSFLLPALLFSSGVHAATSYANMFVAPDIILAARSANSSIAASQNTIVGWANELAASGPWTVMNKTVDPPNGDRHTYMSWAPYSHPDCSKAKNTTELPPEEVWKTCPYVNKDGIFNPDRLLVQDSVNFQTLADAVFYNAIAYALTNTASYADSVVLFIRTWFIDEATRMQPNLDYAQMKRGPDGQTGQHVGVLDLKGFTRIASAILLLRKINAEQWTADMDGQMVAWCKEYIQWLTTAKIAIEEKEATNNHGSFYFNQLAALQIISNDNDGAKTTLDEYFSGIYMGQIDANGEQPLEALRTRPYHYRAYNLAAMITNVNLYAYAAPSASSHWTTPSGSGGTIQGALDYTLSLSVPANETNYESELFPAIASVAAQFGDKEPGSGAYALALKNGEEGYGAEAWFLWSQPLWDAGNSAAGLDNPNGTDDTDDQQANTEDTSSAPLGTKVERTFMAFGVVVAICGILVL